MILLITEPEFRADESLLLNRMLEKHPELLVHLRKPESDRAAMEQLLEHISPEYYSRIVIHQHHELLQHFPLKGLHQTTADREKHPEKRAISTSFHTLSEALESQDKYQYFFCSPVFPSISKPGYHTSENWMILRQSADFRKKAVALGGITSGKLHTVFGLGFRNVALLGAVWQHSDPAQAIDDLYSAYSRTIVTFDASDQL